MPLRKILKASECASDNQEEQVACTREVYAALDNARRAMAAWSAAMRAWHRDALTQLSAASRQLEDAVLRTYGPECLAYIRSPQQQGDARVVDNVLYEEDDDGFTHAQLSGSSTRQPQQLWPGMSGQGSASSSPEPGARVFSRLPSTASPSATVSRFGSFNPAPVAPSPSPSSTPPPQAFERSASSAGFPRQHPADALSDGGAGASTQARSSPQQQRARRHSAFASSASARQQQPEDAQQQQRQGGDGERSGHDSSLTMSPVRAIQSSLRNRRHSAYAQQQGPPAWPDGDAEENA